MCVRNRMEEYYQNSERDRTEPSTHEEQSLVAYQRQEILVDEEARQSRKTESRAYQREGSSS